MHGGGDVSVGIGGLLDHFDKSKEAVAARGEELYRIIQKLQSLLEVCLLHEIGFEGDQMRKIVSKR